MSTDVEIRVTGRAGNPPGQGPFLWVTLTVRSHTIVEATYETYQCPGCHACGKAICELIISKSIQSAKDVTHPTLVDRVGPLPRHRQICYGLAIVALADALAQLNEA